MPKVTKQVARPLKRVAKGVGVVDRILPIDEVPKKGLTVNVYGRSGTGKTTLACTFPKPLLLAGSEDGTQSVRNVDGVDFVMLTASSDLSVLTDYARDEGRYKTVVLDTLGGYYDLALKEVLGIEDLPATKSWGMAKREDWMQANTQVIERLKALMGLAVDGVNVVILAQERDFTPEDRGDLLMPFVASAATPGVVGWLNPECNYLVQTFLRQRVTEQRKKVAGKTVTIRSKTEGVEYCIRTGPSPIYAVKFRLPKGTPLPDVIVDPSYQKIVNIVEGR